MTWLRRLRFTYIFKSIFCPHNFHSSVHFLSNKYLCPLHVWYYIKWTLGFPYISAGKESVCSAGDPGLIPGLGRSPGEANGLYTCLENPMDRGAWQATVYGVARVGHDLATKPPLQVDLIPVPRSVWFRGVNN